MNTSADIFSRRFMSTVWLSLLILVAVSCGGKHEVPPDDLDIPTTLPREQILYREAKETIEQWISIFENNDNLNSGYPLLTWKTRTLLKSKGVSDAAEFGSWFEQQAGSGAAPFVYRFSRLDILEIDLKDTNRASITATFVVNVKDQKFESVGVFYLRREKNAWKVPFADKGDFIRGWWQKEQNFDITVSEAGMSAYAANDYAIEFKYPVAWDLSQNTAFKLPYVPEGMTGLQLTYLNPSNQQIETIVRIAELPADMGDPALAADTTIHSLRRVREEMTHVFSEPNMVGRVYWIYNPERGRVLAIYGAVDTTIAPYTSYADAIDDLVRSMTIIK